LNSVFFPNRKDRFEPKVTFATLEIKDRSPYLSVGCSTMEYGLQN